MKSYLIGILAISFSYTNLISAQESTENVGFKKHELGINHYYSNGRYKPGIQYFYNLNPNRSLGFELSGFYHNLANNQFVFNSEFSLQYRLRKSLTPGLSAYFAPTVGYNYFGGNIDNQNYNIHKIGLGVNAGLEYDFSNNGVPIIIGGGLRTMGYYGAGRFSLGLAPNISLRFKF